MADTRPLHVARISICLILVSLLLFGNPVCLKFTCWNGVDHVGIQKTNSSRLRLELEECNPKVSCEAISFSSLYEVFNSSNWGAKLFINLNFSLAVISNLFQIFMFLLGVSLVVTSTRPNSSFMSWLFGLEWFIFILLIIQTLACPIIKIYWDILLIYRFNYFASIVALNMINLMIFTIDSYNYFSINPTENRREELIFATGLPLN